MDKKDAHPAADRGVKRPLAVRQAERSAKLRRLADIRYRLPYVSQRALVAVVNDIKNAGLPELTYTRELRAARDECTIRVQTPYGPLLVETTFADSKGGNPIPMEFLDPWAGLYWIARRSKAFSDLLVRAIDYNGGCSVDNPLELLLYSDEVTPGNQLAVKNGRKV